MPWAGAASSRSWRCGTPASAGGAGDRRRAARQRVNPGGKLPVTFPAGRDALPDVRPQLHRHVDDRQLPAVPGRRAQPGFLPRRTTATARSPALTVNGIFQGYRWYDKHDVAPLFPFGHGLSYTTFAYSKLAVRPRGDGFDVSFGVRNTGSRAGDEVPQVYVGAPRYPPPGRQFAVRALAGSSASPSTAASRRRSSCTSTSAALLLVDEQARLGLALGKRTVSVGSSSRDLRLEPIDVTPGARRLE